MASHPGQRTGRATGRIVVALDGSPASLEALRRGASIADAFDAHLRVVTVWHRTGLRGADPTDEGRDAGVAEAMQAEAIALVFGGSPPAGSDRRVLEGSTVATLLRESAGAEMLVLGSRGHGGFAGLLLGSVSTACAAHAACAVLVCHPEPAAEVAAVPVDASSGFGSFDGNYDAPEYVEHEPRLHAAFDPGNRTIRALRRPSGGMRDPRPIGRAEDEIVVGVDGSVASTGALRQGARLAESMRLPLLAVCASGPGPSPAISAIDGTALLAAASQQVFGGSPPVWFHTAVRAGTPATVLARASEHARMLVIGHDGSARPTTPRFSMGADIALHAVCQVVVFHATRETHSDSFDGSHA
jgi:nucleotide-binding universal stress UspA family protein